MVKKLQTKFIVISLLSIIIVTGSMIAIITFENYRETNRQIDELIYLIIENNGSIPEYKNQKNDLSEFITMETEFSTRYFTIKLDSSGDVVETNMQHIASVDLDDVDYILDAVFSTGKTTGFYNNYKYKITQINDEQLLVFLDCSVQINNLKISIRKSIIIAGVGYVIVFVIIYFSSKKALKPFVTNIKKQKQFITNAGHELKTPLAVITADLDVLEMTIGSNNEWIASIKNQVQRLNYLSKSLLSLANVEGGKNDLDISEFSLTDVINNELNAFRPLINNRTIVFDDKTDVKMNADINSIKQLIAIFLDNAIKYTNDDGIIEIKIEKQGKNTKIEFSNTCENVNEIKTEKLFDRFYREDTSRNKSKEGYGIGLSIAKSIVDMYNGKIKVFANNEKNMLCFRIII